MKRPFTLALCALALLLAPALAPAQPAYTPAYTARSAHLRAGPARDYPVVAILPGGFGIEVLGCLNDYSWCDIVAGPSRGWMYAGNIDYAYQGGYVPLLSYGPQLGVAIVGFLLFDYWSVHYHDRPWYRDRDEWAHRHGPGWPARPAPRPDRPPLQAPSPRDRPGVSRPPPPQRDRPGDQRPPGQRDRPGDGRTPPQHDRPDAPRAPGPRSEPPRRDNPQPPRAQPSGQVRPAPPPAAPRDRPGTAPDRPARPGAP